MLEIRNIKLKLEEDESELNAKIGKKLGIGPGDISIKKILRRSIDARNKADIEFVYNLLVDIDGGKNKIKKWADAFGTDLKEYSFEKEEAIHYGFKRLSGRVVVVGAGPAGMFSALELARNGYKPLLIERGEKVEERDLSVEKFFASGTLNSNSNIQFGEGGAGTYSDGKLTTRIKDVRCDKVFKTFVQMGAPHEIEFSHKPHIGTDILREVVKRIRDEIIRCGGEILFNTKLTDINIVDGKIKSVRLENTKQNSFNSLRKDKEEDLIDVGALILAIGHSSRDTYEMLKERTVAMEPKPFAIGLRIEHSREMINQSQYGKFSTHPKLGAADYSLAMRSETTGRSAYSFCMCPGGYVVGAASEEEQVVVNGMSEYKRDANNSNSAIVVNVNPEDFGGGILDGVRFQRHWEKRAFISGGGEYFAPGESVKSFMGIPEKDKTNIGLVPTYKPGVKIANLEEVLPTYVISTLRDGLKDFEKRIKGFASGNGFLTGVETRTSAPVRILRDTDLKSINIGNLYPAGEGAGYAGGIVSASVDGIKCAEALMKMYACPAD